VTISPTLFVAGRVVKDKLLKLQYFQSRCLPAHEESRLSYNSMRNTINWLQHFMAWTWQTWWFYFAKVVCRKNSLPLHSV